MMDLLLQMPGHVGWKDKQGHYLGCNLNLANVYKFSHPDKIIGLTDADLHGCTESLYRYHKKNDELALSGKTVKAIHQASAPHERSLFYFVKKPLVDASNVIMGLIFHCEKLDDNNFMRNLLDVDKKYKLKNAPADYQIERFSNPYHLSMRELECLFCLLRGSNAREISEFFGLSKRTIESYIQNIKNKLGCTSRAELLTSAMAAGYMNAIPARFLNKDKKLFY